MCSLLLSEGADPTQLNCHSKSAIDVAPTLELQERLACMFSMYIKTILLEKHTEHDFVRYTLIVDEYKGHCLLDACRQADLTKLKKYLSPEVVNFKHPYTRDTPLHCAVASPYPKRKQVIESLIRKNAALNEKNKDFLTPLHIATDHSHYDAMDVLLRHNAKVNALDGLGQTALHRYRELSSLVFKVFYFFIL